MSKTQWSLAREADSSAVQGSVVLGHEALEWPEAKEIGFGSESDDCVESS